MRLYESFQNVYSQLCAKLTNYQGLFKTIRDAFESGGESSNRSAMLSMIPFLYELERGVKESIEQLSKLLSGFSSIQIIRETHPDRRIRDSIIWFIKSIITNTKSEVNMSSRLIHSLQIQN